MSTRERGAAGNSGLDADPADAFELSAEEAEALAAEAAAAAAAARTKVLRLREEAARAAEPVPEAEATADDTEIVAADDAEKDDAGIDNDSEIDGAEYDDADEWTGGRRALLRSIVKYAAAFLAVVGVAALASTSAWIIVKHRQADHQRDLNADFSAAARQSVVTLMSLNFNNAESDVRRIVDNSTGQFKQDFEKQSADFVKVAEESKVVTEATVTATAVKTMTEDTADVLVSAYSTVTNAAGAEEEPRTWRLIVSMARDGGQIKMAKVEFAP